MKKIFLFIIAAFVVCGASAQDVAQYKKHIKKLTSRKFEGRGYYKNGDKKAAMFIAKQFKKYGLQPVGNSYFQNFNFDVNVYHGNVNIEIDGKKLSAGNDFVMREFSPGRKGTFNLVYIDTLNFNAQKFLADVENGKYKNSFVVVDFNWYRKTKEIKSLTKSKIPGIVARWSTPLKFYKAYSSYTTPATIVWVSADFPRNAKQITIDVDSKMLKNYATQNVVAIIKGKRTPDSTFVFTAHYDHLGHLGKKLYFAGANDNASGTAMLLSLAQYYSRPENAPDYSLVFIAFAGEETGLRGSTYYAENPLLPLGKIKYLINFDMIADNVKTPYVETNTAGERGLRLFETINATNNYFTKIERGELAGNSDHYPFAQKNVPAIFFMTENGDAFKYYHTAQDRVENIYFDNYPKFFLLTTEFIEKYK